MNDSTERDDWQLLKLATAEDTSSYAELVQKYYRPAVAFCFHVLGDRDRAEDMVQRGFVNIYRARERFESRASFKTLLFKVLLNLCINELNRRREPTSFSTLVDADEQAESLFRDPKSPDPTSRIESAEVQEMIRRGVMRLTPKHRAALYLRDYMELSYAEIAVALEASLNEVKIWIFRGRNKLQEILKPYLERGESIR